MKVLQVSMGLSFGGIENIELNIARNINSNFTCDFLTPNDGVFNLYKEEINKLGGNIYNLDCNRKNIFSKIKYYIRLNKFLKKNRYDVIHINSSIFLFSYQVLKLSKKYGCRVISHIHSVPKISKLKRLISNLLMNKYIKLVDCIIAVSKNSRDNFCSEKYYSYVKVIPNAIDVLKYKFDSIKRKEIRIKYNLGSKKVFAYIGRFDLNKNLFYLVDLFYEIQSKNENTCLLLIGDGPVKNELKNKVYELGIKDKVLFLGFIDDVSNILNGIDVCIYPSLSEGFGISILECLTNGIKVFASTNVPNEVAYGPFFKYFKLDSKRVAYMILNDNRRLDRSDAYKYIDYDISKYIKKIESIYLGDKYEN